MGLGQYDSLGEYCGPHTASSVFLIVVWICEVFYVTISIGEKKEIAAEKALLV